MTDPQKQGRTADAQRNIQPADFLLPRSAQHRGARAKVYLSWGGEIYGPATRDEVLSGLRAAWFDDAALYWYEGLEEWRPVAEFGASAHELLRDDWPRVGAAELPAAPSLPARGTTPRPNKLERDPRTPKPPPRGLGGYGRAMVVGFVLLAVLLTVGIILLLMLV